MSLDERLADLAGRAASVHAATEGFATARLKARVRRGRRVRAAVAGAGAVAAVAVVGVVGAAVAREWQEVPPAELTGPTVAPDPTDPPTATPAPAPTSTEVLEGWADAGVSPDVFGQAYITDAVSTGERAVAVGCPVDGASGMPVTVEWGAVPQFTAWVADDVNGWVVATGPSSLQGVTPPCLESVVVAPHGFYASGNGFYRSVDGFTWEMAGPNQTSDGMPGRVDALAAVGDRVTAFVHRSLGDGRERAVLVTTTDGVTWDEVVDDRSRVFDQAVVEAVLPLEGGGAVAIGSEMGDDLSVTAAAWVSMDGLTWTASTPTGEGFDGCQMWDGAVDAQGYVAAGVCESVDSGVVSWTSVDGRDWIPRGASGGVSEAEKGVAIDMGMTIMSVPSPGGRSAERFVMGYGYGDRADGLTRREITWRADSDGAWVRLSDDRAVPADVVELGGRQVGFWPGYFRDGEPVRVLVAD